MTQVTRRKHVFHELMKENNILPKDNQQIVRVVSCRGNNLHEVASPNEDSDNFLVTMPIKFRKSIWIKRGDYVLVEPIEEGNKVKAEICKILTQDDIKELIEAGVWPHKFNSVLDNPYINYQSKNVENTEDYLLLPNLNRLEISIADSSDEESLDEEDDEEQEEEEEDDEQPSS